MKHTKPSPENIPGFWEVDSNLDLVGSRGIVGLLDPSISTIDNLLTESDCNNLIELFDSSGISAPVSVNGLCAENLGIGSNRTTGWSEYIAGQLSKLVISKLPIMKCNRYSSTDWWQDTNRRQSKWRPHALSPMLRFMRYSDNSEHYAHYDAGYIYNDRYRTLKSIVLYLTDNDSGATRFIEDNQKDIPVWNRNHDDWSRRTQESEVYFRSYPKIGKALIFDHRLCHDVEQCHDIGTNGRIIIRGDIIYERIDG